MIEYKKTNWDYTRRGFLLTVVGGGIAIAWDSFKGHINPFGIQAESMKEKLDLEEIVKNNEFFMKFWEHNPETLRQKLIGYYSMPETDKFVGAEKKNILARLTSNPDLVIRSHKSFREALDVPESYQERLGLIEDLSMLYMEAGIKKPILDHARNLAKAQGLDYKIRIYDSIQSGEIEPPNTVSIKRSLNVPINPSKFIIGKSLIKVMDGDVLGCQTDRVVSDWYSAIYRNKYHIFPISDIINWHEGKMIREIMNGSDIELLPFGDTFAFKAGDGKWYGTDDRGIPRFKVLVDKIMYPSTKISGNIAYIVDTHGISSLVSQSIHNNVDLVLGCGDTPAKMQAAYFIAQKGINVFFENDRFIGNVIGYEGPGILMGTAPVTKTFEGSVIGNRPTEFDINEKIIAQNTQLEYPAQYYDAPARYFKELEKLSRIKLNVIEQNVDDIRQTCKVVNLAIKENSKAIAIRVAYEEDYVPVRDWLKESPKNRAILFHSGSYDPGYRLFSEFPLQTTFGDPKPEFR